MKGPQKVAQQRSSFASQNAVDLFRMRSATALGGQGLACPKTGPGPSCVLVCCAYLPT
jgi:hypothetical protein